MGRHRPHHLRRIGGHSGDLGGLRIEGKIPKKIFPFTSGCDLLHFHTSYADLALHFHTRDASYFQPAVEPIMIYILLIIIYFVKLFDFFFFKNVINYYVINYYIYFYVSKFTVYRKMLLIQNSTKLTILLNSQKVLKSNAY
jgi:hypothetical protein